MTPLHKVIINKETKINPIWIMRQAGRYLPEFREIRKRNPDFINLCLNENLSTEITLQPLKRFNLDAAIIFSDILMLPYGLNQKVEFEKGFGPKLGKINLEEMVKIDDVDFFGPAPAPLSRLKGKHRLRFLIHEKKGRKIQKIIQHWLSKAPQSPSVTITTDIDPQNFT